jgi:hypothetical protein
LAVDIKAKELPYPVATQGFFYFKPQPEDYVLSSVAAAIETFNVHKTNRKSGSKAGIAAPLQLVKLVQ